MTHTLVAASARPIAEVLDHISDDQLDAPTPCSEFDVRGLANHLLLWGPSLVGAARKQSVTPPAALDLTAGDWAKALDAHLDELVTAWSDPDAWTGVTRMGGPMEMPAPLVGGMVLGELVVHGWDLARATSQEVNWDDAVLRAVHRGVGATATQGREMGVYGRPVPVPDSAPLLDRILGLTGRDPGWTA